MAPATTWWPRRGRLLRAVREDRGLTLAEAARLCGRRFSPRQLSGWASGHTTFTVDQLADLAAAYRIRVTDLLFSPGWSPRDIRPLTLRRPLTSNGCGSWLDEQMMRDMLTFNGIIPLSAVPSTIVIDPDGRVAARVIGKVTYAMLRGMVDDVLSERQPTAGRDTKQNDL